MKFLNAVEGYSPPLLTTNLLAEFHFYRLGLPCHGTLGGEYY